MFKALTGIRGIASFWVLTGHVFYTVDNNLIQLSYLGVDLFFVLSGFIISHAHADDFAPYRRGNLRYFLTLRITRIWPLHLTVLFAMVALVGFDPRFIAHLPASSFSGTMLLANLAMVHSWIVPFLPQHIRPPGWSWNEPSWSLSVEWALYLLFPAFVATGTRFGRVGRLVCAAGALAALAAFMFVAKGHATLAGTGLYGLARGVAEFGAGAFVYLSVRDLPGARRMWNRCAWGAGAGFSAIVLWPALQQAAPLIFAALLPAIAYGDSFVQRLLASRLVTYLGEISFSLYMIHFPLIQIAKRYSARPSFDSPGAAMTGAATILACVCVGHLTWRFVELPSRRFGRRLARRFRAASDVCAAAPVVSPFTR